MLVRRFILFAIAGFVTLSVSAYIVIDPKPQSEQIITEEAELFSDEELILDEMDVYVSNEGKATQDSDEQPVSDLEENLIPLFNTDSVFDEPDNEVFNSADSEMSTITAEVKTSIYKAIKDAGLSPNQRARFGRVFKSYIDFSSDVRKGDKVILVLDRSSGKGSEDANQIIEIQYVGEKAKLIATRKDGSLRDYDVVDIYGNPPKTLEEKKVQQQQRLAEIEKTRSDIAISTGDQSSSPELMPVTKDSATSNKAQRIRHEVVIDYSLFGAAKDAGLSPNQTVKLRTILDPYIDYTKELRKGDKLVVVLEDGGRILKSIEFIGVKKQLQATRTKTGDYQVRDRNGKLLRISRKKEQERASRRLATAAREKRKKFNKSVGRWKPRDTQLARVYTRVNHSGLISKTALKQAFRFFERNRYTRKLSSRYIVIADYTAPATRKRFHLINLRNGKVQSYQVAHGKNSGPVGGRVYRISNRRNSHMTSGGFFKIGYKEGITKTKGYRYLSVQGLEAGNRKVGLPTRLGGRDIVLHTARYVAKGGRSHGCFAIRPQDRSAIFGRAKGALLYSYTR